MEHTLKVRVPRVGCAAGTCGWLADVLASATIELGHTAKTHRPGAWLMLPPDSAEKLPDHRKWPKESAQRGQSYRLLVAIFEPLADGMPPEIVPWPFPDTAPCQWQEIGGQYLTEAAARRLGDMAKDAATALQEWLDAGDASDD